MGTKAGVRLPAAVRWVAGWPRRRRSAFLLAAVIWACGLVAGRIDGVAIMDLPYGPILADGIPVTPAGEVIVPPAPPQPSTALRVPELPDPFLVATEGDYPPFNFVDATGALRGLEIDLVYAVCAELKVTCEIVARPWHRLLPGLAAADYHLVAASLRVPDAAPDGLVFSQPYFRSAAAYATRKGENASLAAGTIGVEAGTRMAAYLQARTDGLRVQTYPDAIATYQALSDGEVSVIFDEAVRLNRWLNDPSAACCEMSGDIVYDASFFGPGVGFAMRSGDVELAARVNAALTRLASEGRITELSDKYLPFALN